MPRVVHFEIEADDAERAAKFYQKVFGWEIKKWAGPMEYWLVMTGDVAKAGIDGGLYKREKPLTGEGVRAYICTIDVPSVDDYSKRIVAAGGRITQPKAPIPGVGWFASCVDTEGNAFSIMQEDTKAGV